MPEYRILMARSGYYYVQRRGALGWNKIGGFFRTRVGARAFIRDNKRLEYYDTYPRVLEYA